MCKCPRCETKIEYSVIISSTIKNCVFNGRTGVVTCDEEKISEVFSPYCPRCRFSLPEQYDSKEQANKEVTKFSYS